MADLEESLPACAPDEASGDEIPTGHVVDYISGKTVKATPEEVEAVQIFAGDLSMTLDTLRKLSRRVHSSAFDHDHPPNAHAGTLSISPYSPTHES